ncbi:DUF5666 domain-containing protein [Anaerolineales bacterium HSG24]|nr:DUF5666 domain-containing protein [Anaerolineales bacterium HSG24]
MKRITKIVAVFVILLALGSNVAFAQDGGQSRPEDRQGGKRGGLGLVGSVIAVSDSSLTLETLRGDSLEVSVSSETRVQVVITGDKGQLSDIQVGNNVAVWGKRDETAKAIVLLPDGDIIVGRVTAVDGSTITVENPNGEGTIVTTDSTQFRVGKDEATLAEFEVGKGLQAFGTTQSDGSVTATFVMRPEGKKKPDGKKRPDKAKRPGVRGEVVSVDVSAGTLTVEVIGKHEGQWTIQTNDETRYKSGPESEEEISLADIQSGQHIRADGRLDKANKTVEARVIGLIPAEFANSVQRRGEVTAIDGSTLTLNTPRGDIIVLINSDTEYKTRGDETVSVSDIEVGKRIMVIGQLVDGQDNTVTAQVIALKK